MPDLPKKKVGLISCSGEELPEGTLARMATLRVLEQLCPGETVTLCLPLFLAGDKRERAFARFYPTIAIDGCEIRCAARATERYSAVPTATLLIPKFLAAQEMPAPQTRRQLDAAGEAAADALAAEIARQVHVILGKREPPEAGSPDALEENSSPATATCSCGSGVPATRLKIAGRGVELAGLPLIFAECRSHEKSFDELFEMVKIYNAIPAELSEEYRSAVLQEYELFCRQEGSQR